MSVKSPAQRAVVDGVEIEVEQDIDTRGMVREERVTASAPPGLRLELLPSGVTTALGRLVGGQDTIVGDARFDAAFMVKADDEGLARAWLTRPVRRALLATSGYRFELARGRLMAVSLDHLAIKRAGAEVLEAVAALADSSRALLRGWRDAASHLGVQLPAGEHFPAGGLVFDWVAGGVPLQVACVRDASTRSLWMTHVRAALTHAGGLCFSVKPEPATTETRAKILLDAAPGQEAAAKALLTPKVRRALFGSEATAGIDAAGAAAGWPGVEPDARRLRHAVALLGEWSHAVTAPYR